MAWTVQIKPEIDATYGYNDWAHAATFSPVNINYNIRSNLADTSTVAFTIALSDNSLSTDLFGPWRSDFRLYNSGDLVLAGIVTKTQLQMTTQQLQVAGEDYSCYLRKRIYPYIYNDGSDFGGAGLVFDPTDYTPDGTSAACIEAIVAKMNAETVTAVGATRAAERTFSVTRHGTFLALLGYTISPADDATIFDHIQQIGQQDGQIGYDWHIDETKAIHLYAGYYQTPPSLYANIMGTDIIDFEWANNGPLGTREIGFGYGRDVWHTFNNASCQNRFGLLVNSRDFGNNIYLQDPVNGRTNSYGQIDGFPQHDCTVTVRADHVVPLVGGAPGFYREKAGCVITLDQTAFNAFRPFHTIPSASVDYRATELQFNVSNSGENTCTMVMEQIYITNPAIN
jgi:hypothetical protein